MDITDLAITQLVGPSAFRNGHIYQRQSRVLSISRDGNGIIASVRGSGGNRYRTDVEVRHATPHHLNATGRCSCPVGLNCKHVAAVLLEAPQRGLLADLPAAGDAAADGYPAGRPMSLIPGPSPTLGNADATNRRAASTASAARAPAPDTTNANLPLAIVNWLARLATKERDDTYSPDIAQRLIYVLAPHAYGRERPTLALYLKSVRLLKSGVFSDKITDLAPSTVQMNAPPKYLRRSDLTILREILRSGLGYATPTSLEGPDGAAILTEILKTGRARWISIEGPTLEQGPAKRGRYVWKADDSGTLSPCVLFEEDVNPEILTLVATPPVYVMPDEGLVGPIDTGLAAKAAAAMLQAPSIAPAQLAAISQAMRAQGGVIADLAPPQPSATVTIREKPTPILDLYRAEITEEVQTDPRSRSWFGYTVQKRDIGVAVLSFRYGPATIEPAMEGNDIAWMDGDRLLDIRRDRKAEKTAQSALARYGFNQMARRHLPQKLAHALRFADEDGWLVFLYEHTPDLITEGWEIRISPDFPYQVLRGDSDIEARINGGSGTDWFELDLGITIDGERLDLVAPLTRLIARSGAEQFSAILPQPEMVFHLRLDDGRYLSLPGERLKPFVETLIQLFAGRAPDGPLRFSTLEAAQLARLEDLNGIVWNGGDRIRALGRKLAETGRIPDVAVPDTFRATLRPYQARGLAWLDFLREAGLGGILADDMGLGKTVQALALIASEKASGRLTSPALVIAPTSLMANWAREAAKYVADLKVLVLQGNERKAHFDAIDTADLVLSTYPLVARDKAILASRAWHILLLDEAQAIKNPNAATTRQIYDLKARHRFCLTGTPIENNLGELWSLFHFIAPGFLGDPKSFARDWRTPIEKKGDASRSRMLTARVRPFLLRRTKDAVAHDLPEKTEIVEPVTFDPPQRAIYDAIRLAMHERVREAMAEKGLARSQIVVLDALLKLRQVCCDPRLVKGVKGVETAGSAKLDRLMEMIEALTAEGSKILVFSQFTSMLELIRPRLDMAGIRYSLLTGDTQDRASAVNAFQDGPAPVFLVSLKAGGVGLNLTAADTVIIYDPWWNPAVEAQAIDRAHRIGQTKPVFVYKLMAEGTVEEKVAVLKERKAALAANLYDPDGRTTLDITEADIDALFRA